MHYITPNDLKDYRRTNKSICEEAARVLFRCIIVTCAFHLSRDRMGRIIALPHLRKLVQVITFDIQDYPLSRSMLASFAPTLSLVGDVSSSEVSLGPMSLLHMQEVASQLLICGTLSARRNEFELIIREDSTRTPRNGLRVWIYSHQLSKRCGIRQK
jgi:hypothetical protein